MQTQYSVRVRSESGDWTDDFEGGELCKAVPLVEARKVRNHMATVWPEAEWVVVDVETETPLIMDWYVIARSGSIDCPRSAYASIDEAQDALDRWGERQGHLAGSTVQAHNVRITGPYRTRAIARQHSAH